MLGPVLTDRGAACRDDVAIPVGAFAERHGDRESTWDAQSHYRRRVRAAGSSAPVAQEDVQRDVPPTGDPRHEAVQKRCEETEDPSREWALGLVALGAWERLIA
jgi:hypothetical protein